MAIEIRHNTPLKHNKVYKEVVYGSIESNAETNTLNGVSCIAATKTIFQDRFYFQQFSNTANDSCTWNLSVPKDYISGSDIKCIINWMPEVSGGGIVDWNMGLTQKTISNNNFGDENESKYIKSLTSASITQYGLTTSSFIFTGLSASSGDTIGIAIYRHDSGGTNDNLPGDVDIQCLRLQYIAETEGIKVLNTDINPNIISVNKTPIKFDKVKKSFKMSGIEGTGESSSNFHGFTTTAGIQSTSTSLNNRWEFMQLYNSFDDAAVWNWVIPDNYIENTDIDIVLHWTSDASSGNVNVHVGLAKATGSLYLGGESITAWLSKSIAAPTSAHKKQEEIFTFAAVSGSTIMKPNMPLSAIVVRPDVGSPDTMAGNFKIVNVEFRYVTETEGLAL